MNTPIQPEMPPAPVQGNYQPASVTISGGSGHTVNLGQEGPSIQHQTLPQKLASHSVGYWLVHFLIGLAAAAAVELLIRFFKQ